MDLINYKMLNGHVKAPTSIRCHPCKEYNTFEVVDLGVKLLDFCPVAHRLSREEKNTDLCSHFIPRREKDWGPPGKSW